MTTSRHQFLRSRPATSPYQGTSTFRESPLFSLRFWKTWAHRLCGSAAHRKRAYQAWVEVHVSVTIKAAILWLDFLVYLSATLAAHHALFRLVGALSACCNTRLTSLHSPPTALHARGGTCGRVQVPSIDAFPDRSMHEAMPVLSSLWEFRASRRRHEGSSGATLSLQKGIGGVHACESDDLPAVPNARTEEKTKTGTCGLHATSCRDAGYPA